MRSKQIAYDELPSELIRLPMQQSSEGQLLCATDVDTRIRSDLHAHLIRSGAVILIAISPKKDSAPISYGTC